MHIHISAYVFSHEEDISLYVSKIDPLTSVNMLHNIKDENHCFVTNILLKYT